jgi:hypothetical protein
LPHFISSLLSWNTFLITLFSNNYVPPLMSETKFHIHWQNYSLVYSDLWFT